MEEKDKDYDSFSEIVKKAYEKGIQESEITVSKLLEDLKTDLKNMMVS